MAVKLPSNVKRFIVHLNAIGDTPAEVMVAVAQEFSIEVSRALVQHYDPTRVQGRDLSKQLKELFYATRKRANEEAAENLPLGSRAVRLNLLRQVVERNEGKADKIVTTAIEAARREMLAFDEDGNAVEQVVRVINSPMDYLAQPSAGPMIPEDQATSTVSTDAPPASP
jgi:hypothetical protein